MGCFRNKTVICVGSGPSLTRADCDLIEKSGFSIIAINDSWRAVRSAHVLYAGDYNWWKLNHNIVDIRAERWTSSHSANSEFGINLFNRKNVEWHSGLRAVEFAEYQNAVRVILVGYDYSVAHGSHWHGDHKHHLLGNPNELKCKKWRNQMRALSCSTNIEIINCSRETALTCFPRAQLEDLLCLKPSPAVTHHKMSLS
jgi:hypothetical protein